MRDTGRWGWIFPRACYEMQRSAPGSRARCSAVVELIGAKGKLKPKRVAAALAALQASAEAGAHVPLSELGEGVNGGTSVELAVLAEVSGEDVAQTYIAVDAADTWVAITLYNTEPKALKVEDVIKVPEPYYRNVAVDVPGWGSRLEFPSIRVDNPVTLWVNGSALGEGKLAKSELKINSE